MDSQAQKDPAALAFQKPFKPQGSGPLRPFTAVDIAPPAKPSTPGPLGPTVSPFLDSYSAPASEDGESQPAFSAPKPAPEWTAASAAHPIPAPAPQPLAASRQSRIMAASEVHDSAAPIAKPGFFLTTTAVAEGRPIQAYLDVVSAEIVMPKDLLFRNPAPYGELHRLKAAEDQLQKLKAVALEELIAKAKALKADGIVGVTVTFTNLDTVCCLCSAVGTAVKAP